MDMSEEVPYIMLLVVSSAEAQERVVIEIYRDSVDIDIHLLGYHLEVLGV